MAYTQPGIAASIRQAKGTSNVGRNLKTIDVSKGISSIIRGEETIKERSTTPNKSRTVSTPLKSTQPKQPQIIKTEIISKPKTSPIQGMESFKQNVKELVTQRKPPTTPLMTMPNKPSAYSLIGRQQIQSGAITLLSKPSKKETAFEKKVESIQQYDIARGERAARTQEIFRATQIPGLQAMPLAGESYGARLGREVLATPANIVFGLGELGISTARKLSLAGQTALRGDVKSVGGFFGKAAKETPSTVIKSFDPRQPTGLINIGLVAVGVKSTAAARASVRAVTPSKGSVKLIGTKQYTKGKTLFGVEKGTFKSKSGQTVRFDIRTQIKDGGKGQYKVRLKTPSNKILNVKTGKLYVDSIIKPVKTKTGRTTPGKFKIEQTTKIKPKGKLSVLEQQKAQLYQFNIRGAGGKKIIFKEELLSQTKLSKGLFTKRTKSRRLSTKKALGKQIQESRILLSEKTARIDPLKISKTTARATAKTIKGITPTKLLLSKKAESTIFGGGSGFKYGYKGIGDVIGKPENLFPSTPKPSTRTTSKPIVRTTPKPTSPSYLQIKSSTILATTKPTKVTPIYQTPTKPNSVVSIQKLTLPKPTTTTQSGKVSTPRSDFISRAKFDSIINTKIDAISKPKPISEPKPYAGIDPITEPVPRVVTDYIVTTEPIISDKIKPFKPPKPPKPIIPVRTPRLPFGEFPTIKPSFPPIWANLPGGGGGYQTYRIPKMGKILGGRYTPSLVAKAYNIKGKKKKRLTGLEIRPITNNKINKVI